MKKLPLLICLGLPAAVQAAPEAEHGHDHGAVQAPSSPPAQTIVQEAGEDSGTPHLLVSPAHDDQTFVTLRADRLEWQEADGEDLLRWDVEGWLGGDFHKLYLESDGELMVDDEVEEADLELLYSRAITPFWDLQAGLRHDFRPRPDRTSLSLGVQGLAPFWLEVDASGYLSEEGDLAAILEVEYDLLLTQRLVLQPRLEAAAAVQEVEELNIGSGFTDIELGFRLRYELSRKLAPYVGLSWSRKLGETADLVEAAGEDIEATGLVAGVKLWL